MTKSERVGLYPGTFDPVTNGHVDIIRRAARTVDKLIVGVAINGGKGPLFSLDERAEMVSDEIAAMGDGLTDRIEVKPFDSLLVHFAAEQNANCIIRGLRAVSDFEYEFQMVGMNTRLNPNIETLFLMASEHHQFIASRLVKEIAALGGDITSFVSPRVAERINERYGKLDGDASSD
jgi:pantetheine-phosphate adenylyltransferase